MSQDLEEIEKEVLNFLQKGEKSTTEIASKINRNYYSCLKILTELLIKNVIEKIEAGRYTFWRIKNV